MPIFEYECKSCSKKFEELVSSSNTPVVCPQCGSAETRKLLSVFAASAGGSSIGAPSCGSGSGFS
jgi:putative FmdB family regulatory protein